MNSWSQSWSCAVGGGHFPSKTVVGHGIGHMNVTLGVGRVICMKHRDFGKTNRNANYLTAVNREGERKAEVRDEAPDNVGGELDPVIEESAGRNAA